ncbi:uncharacterized protein LOC143206768 isoform X1 [Rhynchophorus ferrugineus]|uniref:uncharacterized protein LOC143206768 isoform X1 n=1 Tax=Rhynchophorus ferrugineus TaxID=354439 RepID=UPI003FCDE8B2
MDLLPPRYLYVPRYTIQLADWRVTNFRNHSRRHQVLPSPVTGLTGTIFLVAFYTLAFWTIIIINNHKHKFTTMPSRIQIEAVTISTVGKPPCRLDYCVNQVSSPCFYRSLVTREYSEDKVDSEKETQILKIPKPHELVQCYY